MIRLFFLFGFILLLNTFAAKAQTKPDTIRIVRTALGTAFAKDHKLLKPRDLITLTRTNEDALSSMKRAKDNYDAATVFGCAGGFLIGYALGSALVSGDFNLGVVGAGAALVGISVPFSIGYGRHAKKAVRLYNKQSLQASARVGELRFCVGSRGVGLGIGL